MYYAGIDYHKKYSVVTIIKEVDYAFQRSPQILVNTGHIYKIHIELFHPCEKKDSRRGLRPSITIYRKKQNVGQTCPPSCPAIAQRATGEATKRLVLRSGFAQVEGWVES